MKKVLAITTVLLLSGCGISNGTITGIDKDTPSGVLDNTSKKFIGVPSLLALEGSTARLNNEWIVTAAHNRPILPLETFYHPKCDIALYKDKSLSDSRIQAGKVYQQQEVFHVGYPLFHGQVSQKGKYIGDTVDEDGCYYSISTAVLMQGMSGGGVYNTKGELIGINNGISENLVWPDGSEMRDMTLFTSLYGVREWIYEVTGIKVYQE